MFVLEILFYRSFTDLSYFHLSDEYLKNINNFSYTLNSSQEQALILFGVSQNSSELCCILSGIWCESGKIRVRYQHWIKPKYLSYQLSLSLGLRSKYDSLNTSWRLIHSYQHFALRRQMLGICWCETIKILQHVRTLNSQLPKSMPLCSDIRNY